MTGIWSRKFLILLNFGMLMLFKNLDYMRVVKNISKNLQRRIFWYICTLITGEVGERLKPPVC